MFRSKYKYKIYEENSMYYGASQGIGFGLLESFLNDGTFEVVAVTRSQEEKLQSKIEHECLRIVACDISTEVGRETLFDALKEMPPLSVLIHNAGTLLFKPFAEITEKELNGVYNVNVFAPFFAYAEVAALDGFNAYYTYQQCGWSRR